MLDNVDRDTRLLIDALQRSFPTPPGEGASGGWSIPPLDVLDCVLSLNRRYDSFCLPRVERFKEQHPEVDSLARLVHLINAYSNPLEFSVQELNYRHEERANTLIGVLNYLLHPRQHSKVRRRRLA